MAQTSSVRTSLGYFVIVVPIATAFQSLEDQVQPDFLRGWSASLAKAAMSTIRKQSDLCPAGGSGRAQKSPIPFQLWKTCSVHFPHALDTSGQKRRAPSELGPVQKGNSHQRETGRCGMSSRGLKERISQFCASF